MMASQTPAFSIRASLRADILRYRALTGRPDRSFTFMDWLTLLSPRLAPNLLLRLAHRFALWRLSPLARLCSLCAYVLFGIEVAVHCPIGPGLFLPHTQGTVIGARAIGRNCTIYHGVTIGAREIEMDFAPDRRPLIEDDVIIGAGSKVLGPIVVGASTRIGSNANVITTVPPNGLVLAPASEIRVRAAA